MIGVRKISHAVYEVPDLEHQLEYYTEVLGLSVTGRDSDAVYLASTVDHHSVVLRKGSQPRTASARNARRIRSRPSPTWCRSRTSRAR
jgi:catechol-2,3-dioxygenase